MLFTKLEEANRKLKDSFRSFIALIEKITELKDPYGKFTVTLLPKSLSRLQRGWN
jgi:hypothetical protein